MKGLCIRATLYQNAWHNNFYFIYICMYVYRYIGLSHLDQLIFGAPSLEVFIIW